MAKLAPTSIKYIIKAQIKAKGVVEKPDVIGAIFGQTEGLLGADMDLRELQKSGRIGRIDVNIKSVQGNSEGEIIIPSSLDSAETSMIAAALETIERIGPCDAEIQILEVEDARGTKREYLMSRAKDILKNLMESSAKGTTEVSEGLRESVRTGEISAYKGLDCGPDVPESEEIVVVEGRADVVNLLRFGLRNVIAMGGTSTPQAVVDLSKEKTITVFVDGDRGGELIVREFAEKGDVDFVAVAPEGKEVEELTQKEALKSLRMKTPVQQFLRKGGRETGGGYRRGSRDTKRYERGRGRERRYEKREGRPFRGAALKPEQKEFFSKSLEELVGTRAACVYNNKNELLGKVPVSELSNTLMTVDDPFTVVFDGKIDLKLATLAKRKGVKFLVGMEKEKFESWGINVVSKKDLV